MPSDLASIVITTEGSPGPGAYAISLTELAYTGTMASKTQSARASLVKVIEHGARRPFALRISPPRPSNGRTPTQFSIISLIGPTATRLLLLIIVGG